MTQKKHIASIAELKEAFKNKHWITVNNCIAALGKDGQKVLLRSAKKGDIEKAKTYATSQDVPEELRAQFLEAFTEIEGFICPISPVSLINFSSVNHNYRSTEHWKNLQYIHHSF